MMVNEWIFDIKDDGLKGSRSVTTTVYKMLLRLRMSCFFKLKVMFVFTGHLLWAQGLSVYFVYFWRVFCVKNLSSFKIPLLDEMKNLFFPCQMLFNTVVLWFLFTVSICQWQNWQILFENTDRSLSTTEIKNFFFNGFLQPARLHMTRIQG